jgi:transposase
MKIKTRKIHTAAFKEAAVRQSLSSPDTVKSVAQKLKINPALLSRWRTQLTSFKYTKKPLNNSGPDKSHADLAREIRALKKKLERVELENDILKKAKEFFDNHQE